MAKKGLASCGNSEEEELDSSRLENLHWCTCGQYCVMSSLIESKCCRECSISLEGKLHNFIKFIYYTAQKV